MNCDNRFCIYWQQHKCILSEISLNTFGACEECIHVNIEEEVLEIERQKILKSYESSDNNIPNSL